MSSYNESLRNLSLKDLKEKAVNLGIRGTTSRTKYTRKNRGRLIDDIIFMKTFLEQKDFASRNAVGQGETNQRRVERSDAEGVPRSVDEKVKESDQEKTVEKTIQKENEGDLSSPKIFRSIKEEHKVVEKNTSTQQLPNVLEIPKNDGGFVSWIIGGILCVGGVTLSILSSKIFLTKQKKLPPNVTPIENIINDI